MNESLNGEIKKSMDIHFNTKCVEGISLKSKNNLVGIDEIGMQYSLGKTFKNIISYDEFKKEIKNFKNITDQEVEIVSDEISSNFKTYSLECHMMIDCVKLIRKDGNHTFIKASDYLRYSIVNCISSVNLNRMDKRRLLNLLKGSVVEIFTATTRESSKGLSELQKISNRNRWFFGFLRNYIKLQDLYRKRDIDRDTEEMCKKVDLNWFNNNGQNITEKQLKFIKYDEKIIEDDFFLYIMFCVIYFNQQLFLVYGKYDGIVYAWIADEEMLQSYLKIGLFVVNISNIVIESLPILYKRTPLFDIRNQNNGKESEKIHDWNKFMNNIQADSKNKGRVIVHAIIEHEMPIFATSEWVETDPKRFHEVEEGIGDNGEITKVKRKGKASVLRAKKSYVYGKKQLKNKSE